MSYFSPNSKGMAQNSAPNLKTRLLICSISEDSWRAGGVLGTNGAGKRTSLAVRFEADQIKDVP